MVNNGLIENAVVYKVQKYGRSKERVKPFIKQYIEDWKIFATDGKCFGKDLIYRSEYEQSIRAKYNLKIKNFSTHSMRKTFGRQVYNNAGNNAQLALVKLSELFNHSDVRTTRKYLDLRTEELMETYDLLSF